MFAYARSILDETPVNRGHESRVKKLIPVPWRAPILSVFRLVKRDVVDRLQRGVGSAFVPLARVTFLRCHEGGRAQTLHEPFRKVGAGRAKPLARVSEERICPPAPETKELCGRESQKSPGVGRLKPKQPTH